MRGVRPRGLVKAAAAVTVVFSLATLADHLHRYLELFSHFRPQYFVAALLLTIVLAVILERLWAGTLLLVTLVNVAPLAPWYLTAKATVPPASPTLKVLQVNVFGGNRETQALLDLVETEQPDLIFLQEVTDTWVAAMGRLVESYPHAYTVPRDDKFGIAAYSRRPWLDVKEIESPPRALPSLLVRVPVDGAVASFLTTHPPPPLGAKGHADRNAQLAGIAALMASIDGPKALVGDLNVSMWSHHYEQLVAATGLWNARYGFGILPTWPRQLPIALIPIDHCLVSKEFVIRDIRLGPGIGSDHTPLIIELALL